MIDIHTAWLPLIVDEGQLGRAEGVVVRLGRGFALLGEHGEIITDNGATMATMPVGLRAGFDLGDFENRYVVATGRLEGDCLSVTGNHALTVRAAAFRRAPLLRRMDASETFVGRGMHHTLTLRSTMERSLMEEGVLLALWTNHAGETFGLATDVPRVRAALSGTFRDIESALADEDQVRSLGTDFGADRQMKVAVTLLHLPTSLAARLSRFPVEAIALDVLVKPAENGDRLPG